MSDGSAEGPDSSEHLADHVVKNASVTEIQQFNVRVETHRYVKASLVADLNARQK